MGESKKKWITNGAEHSFHIQLINVEKLLNKYLLVTRVIDPKLKEWANNYNTKSDDFEFIKQSLMLSSMKDFSIYEIYNIIDVAKILMCIDLEMRINKLCYYNLHNDVFEAIEKLDIVNKLIVCIKFINNDNFKGTKEFEYVREFKEFRNSYAHGKIQEIAIKELSSDKIKKTKIKDNRVSEEKHEVIFEMSLFFQIDELMKVCDKFISLMNLLNKLNNYNENIFDIEDKRNIEMYIKRIKKRCNLIENDLDLDREIKQSLEMILNNLYIDIIKI